MPGDSMAFLLLIEVSYKSGLPETYLLPLAFVKGEFADTLLTEFPQAVLAKLKVDDHEGILCDAFYTTPMQHWLFENLAGNKPFL